MIVQAGVQTEGEGCGRRGSLKKVGVFSTNTTVITGEFW